MDLEFSLIDAEFFALFNGVIFNTDILYFLSAFGSGVVITLIQSQVE